MRSQEMLIGIVPMFRMISAVLGLALCLMMLPTLAEAATPIGKVVAVAGKPTASGPGGNRNLSAGSPVFEDDKITVSGSGNAQIVLRDETKLVVGPGSSLLLDRFVLRGSGTAQKVSIKALRGTFRFITGKSNKSAYEIATSSATIGIRGTGFDFWVRGPTGVAVMEGLVNLCPGGSKNKRGCVTLRDTCEVGRAQRNDAREFRNAQAAGQAIKGNLPYIVNQKPLQKTFWLSTGKCSRKISAVKVEGGKSSDGRSRSRSSGPPGPSPNNPPGPPDRPNDPPDRCIDC